MHNILICDDEEDIVSALEIYLKAENYGVYKAYNGKEAIDILMHEDVQLVLLDIMMPGIDGIETISRIRKISNVPVIFLTAKSEDIDKVLGLNVGADDYVTKPFNPIELQARVKSQLRRYLKLGGGNTHDEMITLGGISINDKAKEVTLDGEVVQLTKTEYDILKFLMQNPGEAFSPQKIYQKVWKDEPFGTENTVAVHIRHLREKIEYDPANPRYLIAVWGRGYKFTEGVALNK